MLSIFLGKSFLAKKELFTPKEIEITCAKSVITMQYHGATWEEQRTQNPEAEP